MLLTTKPTWVLGMQDRAHKRYLSNNIHYELTAMCSVDTICLGRGDRCGILCSYYPSLATSHL